MCANPDPANQSAAFRHKWEMPMIWLSVALSIIAALTAIGILWADSIGGLADLGAERQELRDMAETMMLIPLAPVVIYLYRFYLAARARANALRAGPRQFPELFALYTDLGRRLGMARLPGLYVTNGDGAVNAYALECNRRNRYVVIHAEIALLLPTSPDIVEFVLAHELAHHKLRHVSMWRIIAGIVPNTLILPGLATTRAQEYSADRLALAVCPGTASAVRLLSIGPWMEKGVNPQAWLEQCDDEHREFFVRAAQAMSSHAVGIKRFRALKNIEQHGFARHGEMF